MRKVVIFLVFISLYSCNYFNVKKVDSEAILKEELQVFNWNEVDEYPSFSICDSLSTKQDKKHCFENTLTTNIYESLEANTLIVSQDIKDTIIIKFQISETGNLSILETKIDSLTEHEIPNIRKIITQSLDSLPKIFPAIKRSQQVKTQFSLPIIIEVK